VSLETSLPAVEQDKSAARTFSRYGVHPSWIYYYISFLGLFLFLAILAIINFSSHPEEPVFLSLQESNVQPPSPVIEDKKIPEVLPLHETVAQVETVKNNPTPSVANPLEYHFFTPEELQKVSNQIATNSSENLNVVKAEVFSFLGWYEGQQKLKKDGMDYATRSIQANSQDMKNQRGLALAYVANGMYEKAKTLLSGIHPVGTDSLKDWMDGYLQLEAGRIQSGMTKLELIRKNDPSFYPASYILIQQYLKQNQISKANEIAQFWKNKSLFNLPFVHLMGDVLDRQQQYVELVYYLTPFETMYPKDWLVLYYLGKGNTKLQKRDLAKTYFKRVLDSQENYLVDQVGQATFELGKISLSENDYKNSIQYLIQASQRIPNDSNIRFYLASAYFKSEDYEKAIEIYQQMLLKDQNDPKIRIYLGMAYFELGQFQTAEKNLLLVLNQGSAEPLLLYYLAKIEDQKGNLAKAKEYVQRVLTIEPKHPLALKLLEKLNAASPEPVPTPPAAVPPTN
jgi:pentatricopeptide repeat protein